MRAKLVTLFVLASIVFVNTQSTKPKKPEPNDDLCIGDKPVGCGTQKDSCACVKISREKVKANSIPKDDNRRRARRLQQEVDDSCLDGTQQEGAPWGLDRINQRELPLDNIYSYNYTGKGVNVYLISTGVRATHSDFQFDDGREGSRVVAGYTFDGSDPLVDKQGFGTQSASIIGGLSYGVAKDVTIHSVKVFNTQSSTNVTEVFKAVEWVADNAVKPAIAVWLTYGETDPLKEEGVQKLLDLGIPVVVGAGNQGLDACNEGPANVENAITVAGSASNDALNPSANFGPCVTIVAPGAQIVGAAAFFDNGIIVDTNSNTAPAHVAGALAILMEKFPDLTPNEYRQILLDMATHDVIIDPKGSPNELLFTGTQVRRCKGFENLAGGERNFNVEIDPIECNKPEGFPDVGETPSGLIYIAFNIAFSNQVGNVDPSSFKITAGESSLEALSVEMINPRQPCAGYRVFGAIEQPTAFSEDSTDLCISIDGSKIQDTCGSTFPDYEQCVRFEYCPEAQICAFGMSYSPATTTNDARTVSNENLFVVSFSKPVTDATKEKVKVLGPESYDVEVLVNDTKSSVQYIKVTTPDDYEGPVTVGMEEVHDESGQTTSPIKPLTYDIKTAIAGVRKEGPDDDEQGPNNEKKEPKNEDEAMDRGLGDPNHVCNCGVSMLFNLNL